MTRTICHLALLLGTYHLVSAQQARLASDVANAAAEFYEAREAWLKSDPNLESEIYKIAPEEALRRIRNAAALRDNVMGKKDAYVKLLIDRLQIARQRFGAVPTGGNISIAELEEQIRHEQDLLTEQIGRAERSLRAIPVTPESGALRRDLETERADLESLRQLTDRRLRTLSNLGEAQTKIPDANSKDAVVVQMNEMIRFYEKDRESDRHNRALWATMYQSMEKSVLKGSSVRPFSVDALNGTWTYRNASHAWVGFAEPKSVKLVMSVERSSLKGDYTAELPQPDGVHNVHLEIKGSAVKSQSVRLRWTSKDPPARGDIQLTLQSDGRLLVERIRSASNWIPGGEEYLVRR